MLPTSGPNVCSAHSREGPPGRLKPHTGLTIRPQPQAAKPLPAANSQGQVVGSQGTAKDWGGPEPLPAPPRPPGGARDATWWLAVELHQDGRPSLALARGLRV
ncbi:unnamed protein product, partial [Rangifer tarandus platyrhynchus]